jgi:CDP-4-dehydro-6-deoxyglucose reductase
MHKIFLKNNNFFYCESGETIINAALKNNIFLDHSCLSGRCSSCKYKVIKGESLASEQEVSLSAYDIDQNFILTCVRNPLTDIYLDAEDFSYYGLKQPKMVTSKVSSFEKVTDSILKVNLRLPPGQNLDFIEGQYVDIFKGSVKRSYSIASSTSNQNLEFFIKNYEGGTMSNYWFNELAINDLLRIEGAKGTFFLRDNIDKESLIFVATGTGIAPIKSIVESESFDRKTKSFKNIYIIWGMKTKTDIFWNPENHRINFIPVFSRDSIKKQYVQDVIVKLGLSVKDAVAYVCGSEAMILEVKSSLSRLGLLESDFYSDSFVQSN